MKKFLFTITILGTLLGAALAFGGMMPVAGFSAPVGILTLPDGSMLVAEWSANHVTRVDASGRRETVIDGISSPAGLAADSQGNIYIAGYGDGNIYKWTGHGRPTILAQGFQQPTGLLWTKDNRLLVANRGAGTVEVVDSVGTRRVLSAGHMLPVGMAWTESGNVYVSCYGGTLDRVSPDGSMQKIKKGLATPGVGILPAGADCVFVVDNSAGAVLEAGPNGVIRTLAKNLPSPVGLAKNTDNELIVATWGDGSIQLVEVGNE